MAATPEQVLVRRQHYLARLYLKNFAQPKFGKALSVYNFNYETWDKCNPKKIGYRIDLCSMIDNDGIVSDKFDRQIEKRAEQPVVEIIKELALGRELKASDRKPLAAFIAYTQNRSPDVMNVVMEKLVGEMSLGKRVTTELDVKTWCASVNKEYDQQAIYDYLKPGLFKAMEVQAESMTERLIRWDWHLLRTSRDDPFITSDRPLFAQQDKSEGTGVISFAIAPEVALLITFGGDLNSSRDLSGQTRDINKRTLGHAKEFVAGWKPSFPGDDLPPEKAAAVRKWATLQ